MLNTHYVKYTLSSKNVFCIVVILLCCRVLASDTKNNSYMPGAFTFHASYVTLTTAEFSVFDIRPNNDGDAIHVADWLKIYVGYDPFHISIGEYGISDESLLSIGGIFLWGMLNMLDDSFAYILLLPSYAWCGNLYIPLVERSWLGLTDQSHFLTYVIYNKGFYKRSFSYVNDLGLRFSPILGKDGSHLYLESGVRFEKNFAHDAKARLYLQIGYGASTK